MGDFLAKTLSSKRQSVTYTVIALWLLLGITGIYTDVKLGDLSAYFLSLTGFVGSYIFGESVRSSSKSSLTLSGPSSKRETVIYVTLVIWFSIGIWTIFKGGDLLGMSAYFATLTPFVGSYIISETYKQEASQKSEEIKQINS